MSAQQLKLTRVHISNVKSIEECSLDLPDSAYVFGPNNSGKSNLIFALNVAFGNARITEGDVFMDAGESLDHSKKACVDLMFEPDGGSFSEDWLKILGSYIAVEGGREFFAFRTEFGYDEVNQAYRRKRVMINRWDETVSVTGLTVTEDVMGYFDCFSMDAHRDISEEIRNRQSVWNKRIAAMDLSEELEHRFNETIRELNQMIIGDSKVLFRLAKEFESVPTNGSIVIDPLPSTVSDIYNGLDLKVDEGGNRIPISSIGLGSRSIAVITAIRAMSNMVLESGVSHYSIILLEEPEAHLHPHLQKTVADELLKIGSQKVITTHSPSILAKAKLHEMIHCGHDGTRTHYNLYPEDPYEEYTRVSELIVKHDKILFSKLVVLSEGKTEEEALPILFTSRFGCSPESRDVSFIDVGGGKSYRPFLKMVKTFGIEWIIFSDGEGDVLSKLNKDLKKIFGNDLEYYSTGSEQRVFIIPDGMNIEGLLFFNYKEWLVDFIKIHYGQRFEDTRKSMPGKNDLEIAIGFLNKNKPDYVKPVFEELSRRNLCPSPLSDMLDAVNKKVFRC